VAEGSGSVRLLNPPEMRYTVVRPPIFNPQCCNFLSRAVKVLSVQLLVSVRDIAEADAAIAGNADIIDVKEPSRGSLGMASLETITAIVSRCCRLHTAPRCSAALGELHEWLSNSELFQALAPGFANAHLDFLKVGLSNARLMSDWQAAWMDFRAHFPSTVQWVAVAYADADRAGSPPVAEILEAAAGTGCRVLLLDTFLKDTTTLFNWASPEELSSIRQRCSDVGMRLALAGRLGLQHLPQIQGIAPDLLAVRGAVCAGADRSKTVCQSMVQGLRSAMHRNTPVSVTAGESAPAATDVWQSQRG